MIITADFSQIEVMCFAHLSKDQNLIKLLHQGKDIHKYIASNVYGKKEEDITKDERSNAKTSTFGIIYGNGARTLSQRTGQSFIWAKKFIDKFYKLFPQANTWHKKIINQAYATGQIQIPTGRILKFKKFEAKFNWQKKGEMYYNPPDIKNWPVQALAADIYKLMLGKIFRAGFDHKDKWLLINTIHDSIMIDCKYKYIEECISMIVSILDNTNNMYYNQFNDRLLVPIRYKLSIGESWANLQDIEVEKWLTKQQ